MLENVHVTIGVLSIRDRHCGVDSMGSMAYPKYSCAKCSANILEGWCMNLPGVHAISINFETTPIYS